MSVGEFREKIASRRGEILVFAVMSILYAFSYFQRVAIPGTIFNELQADVGLSPAGVAMLGAVYMYVYGGMQIFSGALVDSFGPGRTILCGGMLLGLGSMLFPLSHGLPMLYSTRVLGALGGSLMFLALIKELDMRVSAKNFSALLSTTLFIGYSGGLMGTKPFALAVSTFGWRHALLTIGIATSIVAVIALLLFRKSYEHKATRRAAGLIPALLRVLRNPYSYTILYSYSMIFSNFYLVQTTLGKKLLEDCAGISSSGGAYYTLISMGTCMMATFCGGFLSRALGNRRKPIILAAPIINVAAFVLMFRVLGGDSRFVLPTYLTLGASMICMPIFVSVMKEANEPEYAGIASGVLNGMVFIATAIFTTAAGLILNRFAAHHTADGVMHYSAHAYKIIFGGCLGLAFTALISGLFVPETRGKNIWNKLQTESVSGLQ